jgi:hypothetical protein
VAGPKVGNQTQIGTPLGCLGVVGDEQRRGAQRVGQGQGYPVEDPLATYPLQALGTAAEAGRAAARQDGAVSGRLAQYRLPRRFSRMTSSPTLRLKMWR